MVNLNLCLVVSHVDSEVVGGWKLSLQVSYLVREWEDGLVNK